MSVAPNQTELNLKAMRKNHGTLLAAVAALETIMWFFCIVYSVSALSDKAAETSEFLFFLFYMTFFGSCNFLLNLLESFALTDMMLHLLHFNDSHRTWWIHPLPSAAGMTWFTFCYSVPGAASALYICDWFDSDVYLTDGLHLQ